MSSTEFAPKKFAEIKFTKFPIRLTNELKLRSHLRSPLSKTLKKDTNLSLGKILKRPIDFMQHLRN